MGGLRTFVRPTAGYKRSNLDESAPINGNDAYHVLFAGDSTISRLVANLPFQTMHPQYGSGYVVKSASRCGVMEYFGLPRSDLWSPLDLTLEGAEEKLKARERVHIATRCCEKISRTLLGEQAFLIFGDKHPSKQTGSPTLHLGSAGLPPGWGGRFGRREKREAA